MAHPLQRLIPSKLTTSLFTLFLLFTTQASALSVAKKAAVGISVGFGTLLVISLASILYLKFSPQRRAERRAQQERERHGEVTSDDVIEFHAREQQRNFNIWDYDHDKVMAKKKAAKEREQVLAGVPPPPQQQQHGNVEMVA